MDERKKDFLLYYVLYLAALGVRALFFLQFDTRDHFVKYLFFAKKLASGQEIGERLADLSPFYLHYLAFAFRHFNAPFFVLELFQLFLGAINCLLLFSLGKRLLGRTPAFIGAMLYAFYANGIVLESTFEPLVFFVFFTLVCLNLLARARDAQGAREFLILASLAGLFAGLSVVAKPNFILFLPLGLAWLLSLRPDKGKVAALAFFLAGLLIVLPVTLRNYRQMDDFILVTADYGKVFFHGNAEGADGFHSRNLIGDEDARVSMFDPDHEHELFRRRAREITGLHLKPSGAARFWMRRTMSGIASRPLEWLGLELKKLLLFFHNYEIHLIVAAHKESRAFRAWLPVTWGLISSLGLLGMILGIRRDKDLFLLYAPVGVFLFSCLVFLVSSRYRAPAGPYLCLFAGLAAASIADFFRARRFRSAIACLACLAFFLAVNFLGFPERTAGLEKEIRSSYETGEAR